MNNGISGVILTGGQARRMGGGDKGLLLLAGKPLVAHTLARLKPQVNDIIINANRHAARYREFADTVVADHIGDYAGPLAGIHAGMKAAAGDWILSVPCDTPFFPLTLAQNLHAAATDKNADIAVAVSGGRPQPVFMLARCHLADALAAALAAGTRKIAEWYTPLPHIGVEFPDAAAFDNINTPEELAQAEARLT